MNGQLTKLQVEKLLQPIKANRVLELRGQSHVPAYDVAAHLTRIFGFGGWDKQILDLHLVSEEATKTQNNKPAWNITYSCTLRLTVRNPQGEQVAFYEDGACGSSLQPSKGDAHDMAMKSAISYALKRCAAFGLGDQFGLALYNKGDQKALVGVTLVMPGESTSAGVDLESHISKPQTLGNDETQEEEHTADQSNDSSGDTGTEKKEEKKEEESTRPTSLSPKHEEIKAHPKYREMASEAKGLFLSNKVGYQVTSIRQLSDDDCEQVLAALRSMQ